jgi:hypothetical protein
MQSTDSLELFYLQIGSTWLLDTLYLSINLPLAIISFFFNSLSFLVFSAPNQGLMQTKREFKFYLKLYCLFSMLLSLLAITNSIFSAPRFFEFLLTYPASFYRFHFVYFFSYSIRKYCSDFNKQRCKMQANILGMLFFFLNTIDVLLLLDRIASVIVTPRLRYILKMNPCFIALALFLLCNLIQAPNYFLFTGRTSGEYALAQKDYLPNFTYCFREPFFASLLGRMSTIISTLLRDFATLLIEIFLTFYSIIAFKKYLRDLRGSNSSHVFNQLEMFNIGLSKMSILLSLMSITCHIFSACTVLLTTYDIILLARVFSFLTIFFLNLKFISNFLLFYNFNQSFREFFRPNYQNHEIHLSHMGL